MSPAPKFSPEEQRVRILEAAVASINETSLLDFTMSAIAKRSTLSMGSVYKHVQTKEDVLIALAIEMFQHQLEVFEAALSLPVSTPLRVLAISLFDRDKIRLYPFDEHLDMLVASEALLQRASPLQVERMILLEEQTEALFINCFEQAVEKGELRIEGDKNSELEQLQIAMWSLCVGFGQVAMQRASRRLAGRPAYSPFPLEPDHDYIQCLIRLMNTYSWQQPVTMQGVLDLCLLLEQRGYR